MSDGALPSERALPSDDVLHLTLLEAGVAVWTWDPGTDEVTWPAGPRTVAGVDLPSGSGTAVTERLVHPRDRGRLRRAVEATLTGSAPLDLEFRLAGAAPDEPDRWLLARGRVHGDPEDPRLPPGRLAGVLLDVSDRARLREECARALQLERRAGRRSATLQQITAALAEATTGEQVAAIMVEESLRRLGAAAARVELAAPEPPPEPPPGQPWRAGGVVRSAGLAGLLGDDATAGSRTVLPLGGRDRTRGRWTLAWSDADGGRDDAGSQDGADLLRALASECTEALDRARLHEQQCGIATALQRMLLPTVLPEIPGGRVAARYQPGGRGVDVGGDWYDVVPLSDGRTVLVIGDVEGHSAEAAGVMGLVRNALRAYAVEGSTPATAMERLNRLLIRVGVSQLVTCCYLEFAPRDGMATVVLAGHPQPLRASLDGRADFVDAPPNLLLGVEESATFLETTVLLDPGAVLVLFTDGLAQAADPALPEGLAKLRDWVQGWDPDDGVESLAEDLVRRGRAGSAVADDIALLALHYLPPGRAARTPGRARAVRRTLPLDPASASAARRFVTDVLGQWGRPDLSQHVALMTSELVTNSVLHTSGELMLSLCLDPDRLRVEVVDRSERLPTIQSPDPETTGGRGLLIVEALSGGWGVESRGDGKAVWFEVPVTGGTTLP